MVTAAKYIGHSIAQALIGSIFVSTILVGMDYGTAIFIARREQRKHP